MINKRKDKYGEHLWVAKYRPKTLDELVFDPDLKLKFKNVNLCPIHYLKKGQN